MPGLLPLGGIWSRQRDATMNDHLQKAIIYAVGAKQNKFGAIQSQNSAN
ncbi:hypothetical protein DsansV1_C16g0142571 [Dioscorea sansibarensis]